MTGPVSTVASHPSAVRRKRAAVCSQNPVRAFDRSLNHSIFLHGNLARLTIETTAEVKTLSGKEWILQDLLSRFEERVFSIEEMKEFLEEMKEILLELLHSL